MKISVVGVGYVGLPAGAGLAKHGHDVTCVDIDKEKVEQINNGECPIYEENLPELLQEVVSSNKLSATTNTKKAVEEADIIFLAVGTPMDEEGNINLDIIKQASKDVAKGLKNKEDYCTVVVKSTVVPKTTEEEIIPLLEESGKKAGEDFGVCMNPEFLREGTALQDFLEPDRIVIGELDEKSGQHLEKIYQDFDAPLIRTSLRAAELIKYASNSLLATKISFINEIGNLCKKLDIDVYEVADGIGMDNRIERSFLNSGAGFGGSCFPKDVRALIKFAEDQGEQTKILEEVIETNIKQKTRLVDQLEDEIEIKDSTIAILGLSFKPGTDDVRQSPAIDIIQEIKQKGGKIKAYDPKAIENMKEKHHPNINYVKTYPEALKKADAALIVTDWPEFNKINRKDLKTMNRPLILEGRKMKYRIPEKNRKGITWK